MASLYIIKPSKFTHIKMGRTDQVAGRLSTYHTAYPACEGGFKVISVLRVADRDSVSQEQEMFRLAPNFGFTRVTPKGEWFRFHYQGVPIEKQAYALLKAVRGKRWGSLTYWNAGGQGYTSQGSHLNPNTIINIPKHLTRLVVKRSYASPFGMKSLRPRI